MANIAEALVIQIAGNALWALLVYLVKRITNRKP